MQTKLYFDTRLLEKAVFYAKHHTIYNINCLFAYSDTLKYFSDLLGELIDVNTYDQPGVEEGKVILKKKLIK